MTCEEFRATFKTVSPFDATTGLRASMVRTKDCEACRGPVMERNDRLDRDDPLRALIVTIEAAAINHHDLQDAEYCEVVRDIGGEG